MSAPNDSLALADPLGQNRRAIMARSLAASFANLLPVPIAEEWAARALRRRMVQHIARVHNVDISDKAAELIASGHASEPSWTKMASTGVMFKLVSRRFRKLAIAWALADRIRDAARIFTVGTLFDHYCARLHVGLAIDEDTAQNLRADIDSAVQGVSGDALRELVGMGVRGALRAGATAPLRWGNRLSKGAFQRLLTRGNDTVHAEAIDAELESQLASSESVFSKAVAQWEHHMSTRGNPYLQSVVQRFETFVRERREDPHDVTK